MEVLQIQIDRVQLCDQFLYRTKFATGQYLQQLLQTCLVVVPVLQVLSRLGIAQAGSGTQPAASWPAAVTTPSGHRVACLSFSDHYEEWAATNTTPGINFIDPGKCVQLAPTVGLEWLIVGVAVPRWLAWSSAIAAC